MKVKVFHTLSAGDLERQINEFISTDGIEISDIRITANNQGIVAVVSYQQG